MRKEEEMIKSVYRFQNGQVSAYDEKGNLMPQYEGKLSNVKDRILRDASPETEFRMSSWGLGNLERVTREQWAKEE